MCEDEDMPYEADAMQQNVCAFEFNYLDWEREAPYAWN